MQQQDADMSSRSRTPQRTALLFWLGGLLLSAGLAWWAHGANQRLYADRLATLSDEVAELVRQRFGIYEYGLRAARGAVVAAGGPAVSREVFAAYMATRDLAVEFPGARGFGFIRRVPPADEARFLVRARAEGPASFAIRELGPRATERFVIQYIYPLDQNHGATGLDVATELNRREAALVAAREGRAQMTAPITLVQTDAPPRRGFLVFLPVYRIGSPMHTPEAREAATIGWAYAPLVVDDVLAGLGPRAQLVAVRLTDSTEDQAFFDSTPAGMKPLASVPEAIREINVHGRSWRLQATALPAMLDYARPLSVAGIAGGATAGSTLLALLLWLVLKRRGEGEDAGGQGSTAPVTLRRFLRSPQLRWAALAYLGFVALYLWQGHRAEWTRQLNSARQLLTSLVDERAVRLREAQQARRKSLVFLADVPPVQGIMRASPSGIDPQDGSRRDAWELRMKQILTAHLNASPEIYRARLVSATDGGRELLRVERREENVVAVPDDELQILDKHPDLNHALKLNAGEVWVSELDLNREQGQLELPHRPTIRYATPVHRPDGQTFGVLMVNLDVSDRRSALAERLPPGGVLYILNAAGDFLLHPVAASQYATDLGHSHRWDDDFKAAAGALELAPDDRLQVLRGKQGLLVAATAVVRPNTGADVGTIRYVATLPMARIEDAVLSSLGRSLALPVVVGAVSFLLLFFYWVSVQRQLQARIQRMRLATIVDQSMDAFVGLDAERRVTSWNRGAQRLFGISEERAIGQHLFELIGAEAGTLSQLQAASNTEGWQAQEFDCLCKDGRRLRVAMTWTDLDEAQAGASSAVLRDVTEERAAQRRIIDLNRGLEQQVQERTEMLDVLAHEVRQPLHNASSALESARSALGNEGRDETSVLVLRAQVVLGEVQRSLDNTLAVASLLARPDPIHLEDADVDTLIRVAIADMPADERGRIQIIRDTATRTVLMDVSLMRLALSNLLSNALKFSAPGSVVLVRIADSDTPLGLLIDVSDRGPGISPELGPRLFSRGGRGSGHGTGHGLGLYIVQQVMRLHHGSVDLVNTGVEGSTFRLTIVQESMTD